MVVIHALHAVWRPFSPFTFITILPRLLPGLMWYPRDIFHVSDKPKRTVIISRLVSLRHWLFSSHGVPNANLERRKQKALQKSIFHADKRHSCDRGVLLLMCFCNRCPLGDNERRRHAPCVKVCPSRTLIATKRCNLISCFLSSRHRQRLRRILLYSLGIPDLCVWDGVFCCTVSSSKIIR